MSIIHQRGNAVIHGNLTPMIDMVFLLIVFFVLVSRIVDRERVELHLPQPHDAATQHLSDEQRVVINVLPASGGAVSGYRVGGKTFAAGPDGLKALTQQLVEAYRINPLVNVNVRADRLTHYEFVEPVVQAVSHAARSASASPSARVNLVVVKEH